LRGTALEVEEDDGFGGAAGGGFGLGVDVGGAEEAGEFEAGDGEGAELEEMAAAEGGHVRFGS
jgi:hypothetical protein